MPSWVQTNTYGQPAVPLEKVTVKLPVSVPVNTFPVERSMDCAVPVFPISTSKGSTRQFPLAIEVDAPLIVGLVKVLLVSVSVEVRATRVSAPDGIVTVPPFETEAMTGNVKVLLVRVSVVSLPTSVVAAPGAVMVLPPATKVAITGAVSVLFVSVSVVARPTSVSEDVGRVRVPVFTMDAMTGAVRVLLVNVSVVALPTTVSDAVKRVTVPVLVMVEITGAVRVLLVSVLVLVVVMTVEVSKPLSSPILPVVSAKPTKLWVVELPGPVKSPAPAAAEKVQLVPSVW